LGHIKAVLGGMFIAMIEYIKIKEISKNNIKMHLKLLEKQEDNKLKSSRWNEIHKAQGRN
jgi:hypothetical protein